jgi:hypothetical protein
LALALPGLASANSYYFTIDGQTGTPGIVSDAGILTQSLVLDPYDGPRVATFVQPAGTTLTLRKANVKMCKPGRVINKQTGERQLEWLDQGMTIISLTGTLSGTAPEGNRTYSLQLGESDFKDNYSSSTGDCSTPNAYSYAVTRKVVITRTSNPQPGTILPGTNYTVVSSPTNTVPEPGTLTLIVLSLLGLSWIVPRRVRVANSAVS